MAAADGTELTTGSSTAAQALYLQAFVNGFDQQLLVRLEQQGDALYISASELGEIGVRVDRLPVTGDRIALASVPNLRYRYDPLQQRLDLNMPTDMLVPQRLGYGPADTAPPRSDTGLVFDYALHAQSERIGYDQRVALNRMRALGSNRGHSRLPRYGTPYSAVYDARNQSVLLDSDLTVFTPFGRFFNNGYTTVDASSSRYVREESYWTHTSLKSLRSFTAGDFINASLTWTRAIRMGGLRLARNFDARPDLVTFPIPILAGSAVVPTTVDLYINGIRQFSGDANPGPFVITSPPALTGAGNAALVYHDALGREVTTTMPLYVDHRMLGAGLYDYALELGYARRNYGLDSFDYAPDLAATASLRYGLNDAFTIESHGEYGDGLRNLGVGGLIRLGRMGVLNAAVSASGGGQSGTQTTLGYQYISPNWGLSLQDQRSHGDYRDLGSLEGIPASDRLSYAAFNLPIAGNQALTLSYTHQELAQFQSSARIVSLGYTANPFDNRAHAYVNFFRDLDQDDSTGVYVGISVDIGRRGSVYANHSRYGDQQTTTLGASRPVEYDLGGLGWNAYADIGDDNYRRAAASVYYRSRYADVSLDLEHANLGNYSHDNAALHATGTVVFMKGQLLAARDIPDGFALVSTRGEPGVPVLRENRLLGHTNRRGYLLVTDLPAYRTSHLAIDPIDLPIDASVSSTRKEASPLAQSGILVEFPISRYHGATVVLLDENGAPLPPGARVRLLDGSEPVLVGYDGQTFFPQLQSNNQLSAEVDAGECRAEFSFDPAQTMTVLGPVTCVVVPSP
ncbi:fimbria/pilus outer membrane usher protein [Lysobacter cavernae]|uniref:Fimbria/pilus outer membrane usher protein n=1 Tax=Lysobacter cavernae TaxID=1685901 RepID=A0ABV7RTF3_9GAMM